MAPNCSRMSASRRTTASFSFGSSFGWWVRIASATASSFVSGNPHSDSKLPAPRDGVGHMVPGCQLRRIGWAMAEKHTQIMHPGRSKEDVVVAVLPLGDPLCEGV